MGATWQWHDQRLGSSGRQKWATHEQIADEDLQDLGLQARPSLKQLLQYVDEHMAERGADKGAVDGHLGDARSEVATVLVAVVGNPRGQELLQAREGARGEHLGAQRVGLQLLQVGLRGMASALSWASERDAHLEVAIGATAAGQGLADIVNQAFMVFAVLDGGGGCLDRLLLELDRHGAKGV